MIDVVEEMRKTAWCSRLGMRQAAFEYMLTYFCANLHTGRHVIVETGTARTRDAWETEGQSTLIWDWVADICSADGVQVISIDCSEAAIANAGSQTSFVKYRLGDSAHELSKLMNCGSIGLLYLDSYDWDMRHKYLSASHILQELKAIWDPLPSGCLIFVDDMLSFEFGKHAAVMEFMFDLKIPPILFDYQIGWIKP